jgi:apolipoprotein D and lipocalin family protein
MKAMSHLLILAALFSCVQLTGNQAFGSPGKTEVPTAENVDIKRFMGRWYSIASFPNYFERRCVDTNANYKLLKDGSVEVFNQCRQDSFDGPVMEAKGKAWLDDPENQAKLRVQFQWPFSAPYWIIYLDSSYQVAMTANPNREYLWILSRKRKISERKLAQLIEIARQHGFDTSQLNRIPQP